MHTTNDAGRTTNELINQGVKTDSIQYYNTHQDSILLDLVTDSDIYDNYSYASFVDWEIEKTPETHPKKSEFNIDKPETSLKRIDFTMIANNDEIDDMNDSKIVHPNDDLADDVYINIEDHKIQQEQTNQNSLYSLANNELQLSSNSQKIELVIA